METYMSSMLRAIHRKTDASSDPNTAVIRSVDEAFSREGEVKLLEYATRLFDAGPRLGPAGGQPAPSSINNYLIEGLFKYFATQQRPLALVPVLEALSEDEPEVHAVIARLLLLGNKEADAVRLLYQGLAANGCLPGLLLEEASFLVGRGMAKEAIYIAQCAVKAAPVDHMPWIVLTRAHMDDANYGAALVALNSCPVTIQVDTDVGRIHQSSRIWLPRIDSAIIDETTSTFSSESVLERLRAPHLRGAISTAYGVLTQIARQVGWEALLALRSQTFVMEEEYGADRAMAKARGISGEMEQIPLGAPAAARTSSERSSAALPPEKGYGGGEGGTIDGASSHAPSFQMPSVGSGGGGGKRLCERWLDNLFMVLFEDMRVYTIFKGEVQLFASEQVVYKRTAREWLIIGSLCARLGYDDDAKDSYKRCIEQAPYCRAAWMGLLTMYVRERRLAHALTACTKILTLDANSYHAVAPSASPIAGLLLQVVRDHGLERTRKTLGALDFDAALIERIFTPLFERITASGSIGHDY